MNCSALLTLFLSFLFVNHSVLAHSEPGYRFICNGLLANGAEREDSCGVCDEEHAARWPSPDLPISISDSPLPAGISLSEWQQVVKAGLAAWEDVPGSNLRFVPTRTENKREFGANEAVHELFWITDREEWRELVGTGEFGTLGATLPRYTCNADSRRQIFDADLVLNGMSHINWQVDCQDDDCISIQTTLVHELGHWFGLDHPCLLCSSSIMSARAGFDLINPVFDDMEGLRALYPDSSTGGFGFPCTGDAQCGKGLCLSDGSNQYCSHHCAGDQECEKGAICRSHEGAKVCAFVSGGTAGGKNEGESCERVPCAEPLVCAGAMKSSFYCFKPCENDKSCGAKQACVRIKGEASVCVTIKEVGETCSGHELCADHLFCVMDRPESGLCRQACSEFEPSGTGCPAGQSCHRFGPSLEVCIADELNLHSPSAGFGENTGAKNLGRGQGPRHEASNLMGCAMVPGNINDISGLVLMMAALLLSRRLRRV